MKHYILDLDTSTNSQHNNEVHSINCWKCPVDNFFSLGWFDDVTQAVAKARRSGYIMANGCNFCCKEIGEK